MSDSAVSRAALKHPDGLRALRTFDGAGHSPTLSKLIPIEAFIRQNWNEDPTVSERLYQESIRRALAKHGVGNDIDNS